MRVHRTPLLVPLAFLAAAGVCAAQDWVKQSPYPAAEHLTAVHFLDAKVGFLAGENDVFLRTSDGGATWAQHPDFPRNPLWLGDAMWDIEFAPDGLTGWAVGNGVWQTVDGGLHWQQQHPADGTTYGYQAVSDQVVFRRGGGEGGVFRSDDGAATFAPIWLQPRWGQFAFFDEQLGLLCWQEDKDINPAAATFRTTDGGQSWTSVYDDDFQALCFLDADVALAVDQGRFYRSADGGQTWIQVHHDLDPVFGGNYMSDICPIDAERAVAIDVAARIWLTTDAGLTWTRTQDDYGNWGSLWNIEFASPQVGYAVGRIGLIFKTNDGGQSWRQISNGAAVNFRDVAMLPSGIGLAVGDRAIVRTEDFGRRWSVVPRSAYTFSTEPEHTTFYSVEAVSDDVLLIGGKGQYTPAPFFRSEDGGLTWTQHGQHTFDVRTEIYDLEFLDEDNGWLFGFQYTVSKDGLVMRTTDGGATWQYVFPKFTTDRVPDGDVRPSGSAWAVHRNPDVLRRSTDHFATSQTLALPQPNYFWENIAFDTDTSGWIGSAYGALLRTEDAGASYFQQVLPGFIADGDSLLMQIVAPRPQEAYVATHRWTVMSFGRIHHTTDGGATWVFSDPIQDLSHVHSGRLTSMDVLPTGEVWTAGLYGFIHASEVPTRVKLGGVERRGAASAGGGAQTTLP